MHEPSDATSAALPSTMRDRDAGPLSSGRRYVRVLATFVRNSLVREMTFRSNFLITVLTRLFWFVAQIVLFNVIYRHVDSIRDWSEYEYYAFMATYMIVFSLNEALFLPNAIQFGERIRTGDLDFALVKPIDPQFLISLERVDFGVLANTLFAVGVLLYALAELAITPTPVEVALFLGLIIVAVAFFYSLMITMAAASIFFGRNTGLQDFWFYVTIFGRYPQSFFRQSGLGDTLVVGLSYVLPIMLVITVPARVLLGKTLEPSWSVVAVAPALTLLLFAFSRAVFLWSLRRYSSASS